MDCKVCREDHKTVDPVPYIVHESAMTRNERRERRFMAALVLTITLLFMSNVMWLYVWMQYDYSSEETITTYTQDGEGVNIIGEGNEVTPNGTE